MPEQIFAIGGASLYPEGRSKNMAEAGASHRGTDKESKKTPATNGEKKAGEKAEEKRRAEEDERKRTEAGERLREELKKERREAEASTTETKDKAKAVAEAISASRNQVSQKKEESHPGNKPPEGRIVVESERPFIGLSRDSAVKALLENNLNLEVPQDWDDLSKWGFRERLRWIDDHKLMTVTKLPEISTKIDSNLEEEVQEMRKSSKERFGEDLGLENRLAFRPEHGDYRDPDLITGFRLENIELEAFEEVLAKLKLLRMMNAHLAGNPSHADWLTEKMNLGVLLDLAERHAAQGHSYHFIFTAKATLEEMELLAQRSPDSRNRLNEIIPEADRLRITRATGVALGAEKILDNHFLDEYAKLPKDLQTAIFGDLDTQSNQISRGLKSGLYGGTVERYLPDLYAKAVEIREKYPEFLDMIEWRLTRNIEGIKQSQRESFFKEPPSDWRQSEAHLNEIFRLIEATDFSIDQLKETLGRAVAIAAEVPLASLRGQERKDAEELQIRLRQQVEAVQAIYTFFESMDTNSMHPEKVSQVFALFEDITFRIYFDRFTKDQEGNYFTDQNDPRPAEERERLNLLDEAIKLYMGRLARERKVMNGVEAMTRRELNLKTSDSAEKWLILRVGLGSTEFHNMKIGGRKINTADMSTADLNTLFAEYTFVKKPGDFDANLKKWVTGTKVKKSVVSDWYRETKLLGAHGYLNGTNLLYDLRKPEMRNQLESVMRSRLAALNYDPQRIDRIVESTLLDQVTNNAYRMTLNIAWSDYDGIRIWNMHANENKIEIVMDNETQETTRDDLVDAYVYNQSTDMFYGRAVDHVWEFYIDERRGKVNETNLAMQSNLLGRGDLFPQNRTLVRFAKLLATSSRKWGEAKFNERVGEVHKNLRNIERLDMEDESDKTWADSAAVAQLIDTGDLSFEDVNWSEVFGNEETNITKYSMIDLYGDRTADLSYTGRDNLQAYLQMANTQRFWAINDVTSKFYSGREVRMKPWMKFALPAHFEIGKFWKKWWNLEEKMPTAERAQIIDHAVETNRLDNKAEKDMLNKHTGWGPLPGNFWLVIPYINVRNIRSMMEMAGVVSKDVGKAMPLIFLILFWGILKGMFSQSQSQLAGK